ncbi:sugar ABC transporter ATP-binding protein [Paenibacillus sp. IB182496]|uniref:Sugar ABC transporter ATP-binding protein n=1 Tax=Paenibacillus sabuli TaxID=2772509 RepID=A0A927BQ28_9BACL|nr:sugar ABC transporter ATP-binding protein [Paenibacillus sabuli]MBD2844648.1 sugar ABC transporter ATP-binding protein [Paenibacillus sabuli]
MTEKQPGKLEMQDISIAFPGVQALKDMHFCAERGRVHALIGANGAGKSTLMKILGGAYDHYTGTIKIDGAAAAIRSPRNAKTLGIQVVYQEVDTALIPSLSVGENLMLEQLVHDMKGRHLVRWRTLHRSAQQQLDRLQVRVDSRKLVQDLTLAEKQMVLIARAASLECRYLVLDEPTAPLSSAETAELFRLVRELKASGVGIIFISHRLPELYDICDDITIMRDGRFVLRERLQALRQEEIVEHMLGARMELQFPRSSRRIGEPLLEVRQLRDPGRLDAIDLSIRKGEIVGLAGLVGAGKTELCRALFGASRTAMGEVVLDGRASARARTPYQAVRRGFALVPEERRKEGILVQESVGANLTVPTLGRYSLVGSWIRRGRERRAAEAMIGRLGIKTPSAQTRAGNLSGGNQQKIAIGKWLLADAAVYLFDEPTKGVDVGAKRDIFQLVDELAQRGKCVLYATSELSEIVGITDRVYVMYDGKIVKELETAATTEEELLFYSTGGGAT